MFVLTVELELKINEKVCGNRTIHVGDISHHKNSALELRHHAPLANHSRLQYGSTNHKWAQIRSVFESFTNLNVFWISLGHFPTKACKEQIFSLLERSEYDCRII